MDELKQAAESGAPAPEEAGIGAGRPAADSRVEAQLARIRAMDPEMHDLGDILRSDAGVVKRLH